MDYKEYKSAGIRKYQNKKINRRYTTVGGTQTQKYSRSVYVYGKYDKSRNVRRIADRHSHHRVRNMIRNSIAKGDLQDHTSLPGSTSRLQRGTSRSWITNYKSSNGHYRRRKTMTDNITVPKPRDPDGNLKPKYASPSSVYSRFDQQKMKWILVKYSQ